MSARRMLLTGFLLSALLFSSATGVPERFGVSTGMGGPPTAEAASGALSPVPPNFTFDAPPVEVGSPPLNYDFSEGGEHWTVNGAATFPGYASITSGYIESSTFVLDPSVEAIHFLWRVPSAGSGAAGVEVRLWDDTWLSDVYMDCESSSEDWLERSLRVDWGAGQAVKIRVLGCDGSGTLEVDDVGVQYGEIAEWTTLAGHPYSEYGYVEFGDETAGIRSGDFTLGSSMVEVDYFSPEYPDKPGSEAPATAMDSPSGLSFDIYSSSPGHQHLGGASVSDECRPCGGIAVINVSESVGQNVYVEIYSDSWSYVDNVAINQVMSRSSNSFPSLDAGEPVDTSTGQFTYSHTDLLIPGRGVPLEFTRTYRSLSGDGSELGPHWTHTYSAWLRVDGDGSVSVRYPDGSGQYFRWEGASFASPPGIFDTLVKNPDDTYTLTTRAQVRYNFSSEGRLASIVDRNDNLTTLSYDPEDKLSSVTDSGGRALTFSYENENFPYLITRVTDPLPPPNTRTVEFSYDADTGDLVTVTDVKGGTTTYTYSIHRMTSLTDSNGHLAMQNVYDTTNRAVEQTDAVGGKTCFYYGSGPTYTSDACPGVTPAPVAGQTVVVEPRGNKTTYDFDASFRTTDVTDALGGVVHYDYDSDNKLTCVTDQEGHKAGFGYDSMGNVTQIVDAENTDANCQLESGGTRWTFAYTALNDIDLETDPRGNQTDYGYDGAGNLTSITRKDSVGTPLATTSLTRDPGGNGDLTAVTDANGHTTSFTYDSHGLLDTVDGPLAGPPNDLTDYDFDAAGRLTSVTDANGKSTSFEYDAQNNVTQVVDAENGPTAPTTYTYDPKGNRTSVTNARGKTTTFDYDDMDRLWKVTDPLGRVTEYLYDPVGNLERRTDARGWVTTYEYDGLNRLTDVSHWEIWEPPVLKDTVHYGYYADGLRQSMTDPTGTTSYEYFDNHQLKKMTDPAGNAVQYTYDPAGNRASITYPDPSKTVTYTYDAFDRMETVTDWLGQVTTYDYDDAGNLLTITYPPSSGLVSTRTADAADRLETLVNSGPGGPISSFAYVMDPVGNRTQVTDNTGVTTYGYDDLYRLTGVTYPGPSTTSYAYDPVGNRLTLADAGGTTNYVYDDADQLTSATPPGQPAVTYTWDDNGNLTGRSGGAPAVGGIAELPDLDAAASASSGGSGPPIGTLALAGGVAVLVIVVAAGAWRARRRGPVVMLLVVLAIPLVAEEQVGETHASPATAPPATETFSYDHENRLLQATVGGDTSSYIYNGDGFRVSRTVGTTTSNYTWDAGSSLPVVLQETSGGESTYYVYGLDLISSVQGTTAAYYLTDGLGSTTELTNSAGVVAGAYTYDVFGSVRSHSGSATQWSFTGEQNDPTGLEYLRARYYEPANGRFLSRDPFEGFVLGPQSQNRYPYVVNNPALLVDPYGLCVFGLPCPSPGKVAHAVSTAVQIADILPWGAIPVVNIISTPVSIGADLSAAIAGQYDILTSPCSLKKKFGMTIVNAGNLTIGVGGQLVSDLTTPSVVGPVAVGLTTSAVEGTLYTANTLAIDKCEKQERELRRK